MLAPNRRRAPLALLSLVTLVVVSGACHKAEPPPVGLGPITGGPLVFPPPLDGWKDRTALPTESEKASKEIGLSYPSPDATNHIEVAGREVRLAFDDDLFDDPKRAPKLTITPAVRGKTVWNHPRSVTFTAEAPFDTSVEYTATLPDLTAPSGRKLTGFSVKLEPKLAITVSGKTLTYVPERGKPRVLATQPMSDEPIGGAQEIRVVYDQPVDLALAKKLVTVEQDDKPVAVTIGHLAGGVLDGEKVDPRMVVVVRPVEPRKPGTTLVLFARSEKEGEEAQQRRLTVASPTVLEKLSCAEHAKCEVEGTHVLGSAQGDLHVKWSNPAGRVMQKENVTVTPPLENLYVWGWGETTTISGSWKPSKTYTIRIGGGRDDYGGAVPPVTLTYETRPLPASLGIPPGPMLASEDALRAIPVTARNVVRGEVRLWALPNGDADAFGKALRDARAGIVPSAAPSASVGFAPPPKRDQLDTLDVDVAASVERGRVYLAQVAATELVPHALGPDDNTAREPKLGAGGMPTSAAVLVTTAPESIGAHVHQAGDKAVVQVFTQATGEPVAGANVTVGGASATTDASGAALVAVPRATPGDEIVARVEKSGAFAFVPFGSTHATTARQLFPDLAQVHGGDGESEGDAHPPDMVGMIVTDRGIYKPGSKISLKGFVRRVEASGVRAVPDAKVRLHVLDGTEQPVLDEVMTTSARGTLVRDIPVDKNAKTGRWHVKLELEGPARLVLADETVRVSAYERPRFKVDVETQKDAPPNHLRAKVIAKYLFGGAMSGANVSWSLRTKRAKVKGGALEEAGLSFEDEASWWRDEGDEAKDKPIVGEGKLDDQGVLVVDAVHPDLPLSAPSELTLEADVSDASNRHVAGQAREVRHTAKRYAGLRLAKRFGEPGPLRVELGVVDTNGNVVPGVKVSARLERLTWTRTAEKAESGALVEKWKDVSTVASECEVTSGPKQVSCELTANDTGSYRVVTQLDGHDAARTSYYAWRSGSPGGDAAVPSSGKKVPLVLDKGTYGAGETAKLLVQSPFASATALLTIEQGGIVRHEAKRIEGAGGAFDVPITGASAPWVNAVVTLLPIGGTEPDYRVGVVRIPVKDTAARLDVKVSSAKPAYEVRDDAEITIEVKRGGAPVKNADVTLALVDEGVLRLTGFHAKDPATALHPGRELAFRAFDTRAWMLRRREKAHVAGGGENEEDARDTRKNFVETAAFVTDLVTDGAGRVTAKVKLPDDLTELRMMAVAVDETGAGGKDESSFVVTKPILLEPVMPRFALRGDTFEAAAMVHNNTEAPVAAKVTVAGQVRDVTVPAKGHVRASAPMTADAVGTKKLVFAVEALGKTRDRVEIPFRVDAPGVTEHPAVSGVLLDKQEITLAVPADALFDEGAALSVKTGSALYPELGRRLAYLLDYPHGCVEQTTSSTLPLLAARTLLPWTGTAPLTDAELDQRIRAGIERLATMTTESGGLSYWPGGHEPNTFGTAYALHALVGAQKVGIERPKLVDAVTTYLVGQLGEGPKDTRLFVAEALAKAGKLPESAADTLWDMREGVDPFARASLALALGSLPKQEDRVRELLDALEKDFDEKGDTKADHARDQDWWIWSSHDRDRAQALVALQRHRPTSKLTTVLAQRLARELDGYTTQATAWSLVGLAEHVGSKKPDGGVDVKLRLEGRILDTTRRLGGDNKEVRIPLKELAGKKVTLVLQGDGKTPSAFELDATYKRPFDAQGGRVARRAAKGPSIHRVITDPKGRPVDLAKVAPGQVVRVALRVDLPEMVAYRRSYIAITDHLPAGFEPIDPDLATVARVEELGADHPFSRALEGWYGSADHVDLRDDRVQIYFDHAYSSMLLATYLARATTPGTFALQPTHGELMYEPGSDGYGEAGKVTIAP